MKPEVLLIDLSSLFWTAAHAVDNYPEAAKLAATAVRRAVGMCESPLTVVCCDQGKSFRKALAPDYKAKRAEKPVSAYAVLDGLKESLAADAFLVVGVDGFEADDVIATFATKAAAAEHPVIIASADKDLLQLLALPDTRQIRTFNNWDTWRPANVVEKFGVEPEGLRDLFALMGDASDNIPGVPSVGAITAKELLLKHLSLDELYHKVDALQVFEGQVETKTPAAKAIGTPAIVDKLHKHKADAFLAQKLVTLRTDVPIDFEALYQERQVMTKKIDTTNMDAQGDIFAREPAAEMIMANARTVAGMPKEEPKPEGPKETTGSVSVTTATTEPDSTATAKDASGTDAVPPPPSPVSAETSMVPHVVAEVEYEHALEPRSPAGAITLGEVLYASRAFQRFPTAGAITATIMRGRELGISALASLDAFHFVAELGRILPGWQVLVTLAEQSPDCEYIRWVGGDDKAQTWETKHRKHDKPQALTYTFAQAEKTGLVKPDKPRSAWMARPDEMLRKTAACQLARAVYPGATLGLYAAEEMGGES